MKGFGGKVVVLLLFVVVFLGLCVSSAPSHAQPQKWWQSIFSVSSGVNPIGSSVVFPLHGDVYPSGFYYVELNIGQPPKPYFLDPDTGSDLTWVQCDATPCYKCTKGPHPLYKPNNNLVICRDPLCAALHSSEEYNCDYPDQCDYEVTYADNGYSIGVLVKDAFVLNLTNGEQHHPHLAFGCGYNQQPGASYHLLDGVLGLGKGKSTIISQLNTQRLMRNVVGHCLSERGGFLFFGDGVYDTSRVVWTPMSRDYSEHYSPGFAEFIFGGKTTGHKNLPIVFDSGSSYSYLNSQAYQAFISLVTKELSGKPLEEAEEDQTLPFCWKGKKPFKNIRNVRRYFKPIALSFANGWKSKSHFEIPPEGYLIISSNGNVCLGILNGTEIGITYNIIGDISMQDKMVIYDNEKQMIGWAAASCDRIPKSKTDVD
ncbi:hypothetical protein F0562_003471 [Nyssa sinensis]|uniref:Aspartic proteinase Asp1 n=1 Tax=Nyssa sinensis TaxID=561372 RepID=A0A5J5BZH4_9ASTE|nr:hypothetical protein F0562_003471 [Nyssa sinensis]